MSEISFKCSKCGGNMVRGYAADHSDRHYMNLSWIDGEPELKTFLGITAVNLNVDGKKMRVVRGMRCEKCGFLEQYAV